MTNEIERFVNRFTDYPEITSTLQQMTQKKERPLVLAIVGEFSAGKSTFINALLQRELLPDGPTPTTGVATRLHHGDQDAMVVSLKDGATLSSDIGQLQNLSTHHGQSLIPIQDIVHIDVYIKSAFLKNIIIVDTPGLNAPNAQDHLITEKILDDADAIVWLMDCKMAASNTQITILKKLEKRYTSKSLLVLSKIDLLKNPKEELLQIHKFVQKHVGSLFTDIVNVSAFKSLQEKNLSYIQSFLDSFFLNIVPNSRKIVQSTILFEMNEFVQQNIIEYEDLISSRRVALNCLSQWRTAYTKSSTQFNKKMTEEYYKSFNGLKKELTKAKTDLVNGMDFWTTVEPYTVVNEGWFVDDTSVAYRTVNCWKVSEHSAEKVTNQLISYFEKMNNSLYDLIFEMANAEQQVLENQLQSLLQNDDWVTSLRYNYFDAGDINEFLRSHVPTTAAAQYQNWQGRMIGGMQSGGCYGIIAITQLQELRSRPSLNDMENMIKEWMPFHSLIETKDFRLETVQTAFLDSFKEIDDILQECLNDDIDVFTIYKNDLHKCLKMR